VFWDVILWSGPGEGEGEVGGEGVEYCDEVVGESDRFLEGEVCGQFGEEVFRSCAVLLMRFFFLGAPCESEDLICALVLPIGALRARMVKVWYHVSNGKEASQRESCTIHTLSPTLNLLTRPQHALPSPLSHHPGPAGA